MEVESAFAIAADYLQMEVSFWFVLAWKIGTIFSHESGKKKRKIG